MTGWRIKTKMQPHQALLELFALWGSLIFSHVLAPTSDAATSLICQSSQTTKFGFRAKTKFCCLWRLAYQAGCCGALRAQNVCKDRQAPKREEREQRLMWLLFGLHSSSGHYPNFIQTVIINRILVNSWIPITASNRLLEVWLRTFNWKAGIFKAASMLLCLFTTSFETRIWRVMMWCWHLLGCSHHLRSALLGRQSVCQA